MRTLPAAAVKRFTTVQLEEVERHIVKVENSTPRAGRITWTTESGSKHEVGGTDPIQIIELP